MFHPHPHHRLFGLTPMAVVALATGLVSLLPATAMGATLKVGSNGCTLANAIRNANTDSNADGAGGCPAGSGADTITLPSGSSRILSSPLPDITSVITIKGNGATVKRKPDAPPFRIFTVRENGNLSLNRMTISGGQVVDADPEAGGQAGGGVLNVKGSLQLNDSTVSGNSIGTAGNTTGGGGGVATVAGTTTITNSTVSGNHSHGCGGGIGAVLFSTVKVVDSTLSGNTAEVGGGGGCVFLSQVEFTNSTVSANTAIHGGGGLLLAFADTSLTDSTISGNRVEETGLENEGGGGVLQGSGTTALVRSLIAGNSTDSTAREFLNAPSPDPDNIPVGTVTAGDHNLFGFSGDAGIEGFTLGFSDLVPTQAKAAILSPLASKGGPTQTHPLPVGSPAIDAAGDFCSDTDQRNVPRPQGAACDIGAFEFDGVSSLVLTPASASHLTLETQCVTVTASNTGGDGVPGAAIDFSRSGANPGSETLSTNELGQAEHCWDGINGGVDRVTAHFDTVASNESVITWNKRGSSLAPEPVVAVLVIKDQIIRIAPRATLSDANGGPIEGRSVKFSAGNAQICTAVTDAAGLASCKASLSATLQGALSLGYTTTFAGDGTYKSSQKKGTIVKIEVGF